jgi:hypothetical protein
VFGLNNLLCALLLLSLQRFCARPCLARACTGCLVSGLALSNQHTTVFYILPCALWVLYTLFRLGLLTPWVCLQLGLCGLVGLTPYLYLPLAAARAPMDGWGSQLTVDGFLTHFLRKE